LYISQMSRSKHYKAMKRAENYRSGFEKTVITRLKLTGIPYEYETLKLSWIEPAKHRTYTPDIILENGIIVEVKGYWDYSDRMKMLEVIKQHPDKDIRMLFQRARNKIRKGSKTSYADWCDKHNIKWAQGEIPMSWIKEKKNK